MLVPMLDTKNEDLIGTDLAEIVESFGTVNDSYAPRMRCNLLDVIR